MRNSAKEREKGIERRQEQQRRGDGNDKKCNGLGKRRKKEGRDRKERREKRVNKRMKQRQRRGKAIDKILERERETKKKKE